jgi:hypothetical protein
VAGGAERAVGELCGVGSEKTLGQPACADGSQQVWFSLRGPGNTAASASGTSLSYPGILPGTDITDTTPDGISELLALASAVAGTSWTFRECTSDAPVNGGAGRD